MTRVVLVQTAEVAPAGVDVTCFIYSPRKHSPNARGNITRVGTLRLDELKTDHLGNKACMEN